MASSFFLNTMKPHPPVPQPEVKGQGLLEVKQLLERELGELKAQLERTGFSSLYQMR